MQLGGWSVTDNSDPRQFVFPVGTTIPGGGFLKIECQQGATGAALVAPFQLDRTGETVALFDDMTNRVDAVRYGPVVDRQTLGLIDGQWTLCEPTPLEPNQAAVLGQLSNVKLN